MAPTLPSPSPSTQNTSIHLYPPPFFFCTYPDPPPWSPLRCGGEGWPQCAPFLTLKKEITCRQVSENSFSKRWTSLFHGFARLFGKWNFVKIQQFPFWETFLTGHDTHMGVEDIIWGAWGCGVYVTFSLMLWKKGRWSNKVSGECWAWSGFNLLGFTGIGYLGLECHFQSYRIGLR